MIEGQDIICFSNDWDSDPLSKKHVILRFAKHNRVLWINSIGNRKPTVSAYDFKRVAKKLRDFAKGYQQVQESIYVFSPLAVPFFGNRAARWINRNVLKWSLRRACRQLGFENPMMWTFYPASGNVVGTLGEKTIVYHCVDEYSEFTGTDKEAILQLERELMSKCDYVIVSSDRLYETKKPYNKNTFLVTHGVDVDHFRRACDPETVIPEEIKRLPGPVVGFFGLIADWVDLDMIRFLAVSRPDCSFALIGKVTTDVTLFDGLPNVHLLGPKPYEALPAYVKAFDVAILPFVMNELTIASNPLKLREYLAAGLPVVSSAIPEACRLKHLVRIGRNKLEFLNHVNGILESGHTGPQMRISSQMDVESWDRKVEELGQVIAGSHRAAA
jgi:glycosyltransferase involved in cell wall biosynthesis